MAKQQRTQTQKQVFVLTSDAQMATLAQKSPRAAELLSEYGLHCMNCIFNKYDTVKSGAKLHGMTDEETQTMIDEINEQLQRERLEFSV